MLPGYASVEIQTRALSWRETPNNAPHRSRHAERDDNMKEHLNRTAWGSCNSNCYILSEQQQRSGWPHYVSLSLVRLLMNHQGKHSQGWRMQGAGSCTARLVVEDSAERDSGKERGSGTRTASATGIYWGITCIITEGWNNLIFVCRGCRVLRCSNICGCI